MPSLRRSTGFPGPRGTASGSMSCAPPIDRSRKSWTSWWNSFQNARREASNLTIANWTPYEIAGELIEKLRKRRRSGSSASQLVPFLEENNVEDAIAADCFQLAFCLQSRIHFSRLRKGPYGTGRFDYEKIDRRFEPMIQEARDRWESAPPYPDLMGRSHREAFRWLALKRACYVIIRAPNPYSKAYVGKPGFRAAPAFLVAVARLTPPNPGPMAAD